MSKPFHILVVDDDELDVLHVRRTLEGAPNVASIAVATDGLDALAWLRTGAPILQRLVMLVDWRMPRMNGHELLAALKDHVTWRHIPVIIMSTSADARDRDQAYQLGAAGYFVKPGGAAPFRAIMDAIGNYWSLAEFAPFQQ